MSRKRITQRDIGFTQGIAYCAGLVKRYGSDSEQIIKESGISIADFRKYADEYDLETIEEMLDCIEGKKRI